MSRLESLQKNYDSLLCNAAGNAVCKMLEGFAEILDNSENVHTIDTDLVDIYAVIGLKNSTTIQLTGQITDIDILPGNYVTIRTEDRKVGTMPNSTFIFCLNDVVTIQSLDIVQHQKRLEARMEAELSASQKEKSEVIDTLFPEDNKKVTLVKEPTNKEAEAYA